MKIKEYIMIFNQFSTKGLGVFYQSKLLPLDHLYLPPLL